MKTIVGLYKTVAEATKVKAALASEGYEAEHITVIDQTEGSSSTGSSYGATSSSSTGSDSSVGSKIKNFFGSLSGHDEESHNSYTQGVTNGGALLAVTVPDEEAEDTADMLYQHGASEIEGGYGTGSTGSSYAGGKGTGTGAEDVAVLQGSASTETTGRTTGEQVIPVLQEDLLVGKRQVERGGVRIYSRVVSEPVSENISLHDERVVVDRRPVDRPATEADFTSGTSAVEVRATGEEAVVGKRSRVVEEILVGKEASDRTEQITDTVRHTEVDVEPTTVDTVSTSTTGTTGTGFNRS